MWYWFFTIILKSVYHLSVCNVCVLYRLLTSANKRNYDARGKVIGLHVFAVLHTDVP